MDRAKGFARELYLFLFKAHGLNPDCDCEVCSDIGGTSPSDFTEDIGKAILMLSYAYRWEFRKSFHDSCQTDETFDTNVNQCKEQLYSYALVFSSISCKKPDVLKILVICSFISEMYLFLNARSGHNNRCAACSYLEQARICFLKIFRSVIRKKFDGEHMWRDLAHCARKISSGYGLYKPFMNTENVLSETHSPLTMRAKDSTSSEDDESVRSEDETMFTPPKSDSILESRKRKRISNVTNKYRTLYNKSSIEGEFTPIEHIPALNPVGKSKILENISLLKERFANGLSREARYIPSLDPQNGSVALNESILESIKHITHNSSLEVESSRPELNSCGSSSITGKDSLTLQDQCYLKSVERFTHESRVESNVPEMRSQRSNAKMGVNGLNLQECNLKLEQLNLNSDIEVQSNIQEINSQSSMASTGEDSWNLQEQCIFNQTECHQSTSNPVLGNSAPVSDILYSGQSSSESLVRHRLVGWDPVNSCDIWVREKFAVGPRYFELVREPLTQTGHVNAISSDNPQVKSFEPATDSSNPTSELKMVI